MKTIEITQEVRGVAQAASTDKGRKALGKMAVRNKNLVATNGFILAWIPMDVEDCTIPSSLIKEAKKSKVITPYIDIGEDSVTLQEVGSKKIIHNSPNNLESYPKIEKVMKAKSNKYLKINLGVEVLETVIKVLKKAGRGSVELSFSKNPLKPIYADARGIELVIMPMNISRDN